MARTRDKVVDLVNSVVEVEKHFLGLLLDFVPQEARKHVRAAHKEKLLALRALLDARIKQLEEDQGGTRRRPKKVKVE
jgi:hypothetical protein